MFSFVFPVLSFCVCDIIAPPCALNCADIFVCTSNCVPWQRSCYQLKMRRGRRSYGCVVLSYINSFHLVFLTLVWHNSPASLATGNCFSAPVPSQNLCVMNIIILGPWRETCNCNKREKDSTDFILIWDINPENTRQCCYVRMTIPRSVCFQELVTTNI